MGGGGTFERSLLLLGDGDIVGGSESESCRFVSCAKGKEEESRLVWEGEHLRVEPPPRRRRLSSPPLCFLRREERRSHDASEVASEGGGETSTFLEAFDLL